MLPAYNPNTGEVEYTGGNRFIALHEERHKQQDKATKIHQVALFFEPLLILLTVLFQNWMWITPLFLYVMLTELDASFYALFKILGWKK